MGSNATRSRLARGEHQESRVTASRRRGSAKAPAIPNASAAVVAIVIVQYMAIFFLRRDPAECPHTSHWMARALRRFPSIPKNLEVSFARIGTNLPA